MLRKFRRHMYTDLQYSLRKGFEEYTDIPMVFIKNGEDSPIDKLPIFHLIEEEVEYDMISKQRESIVVAVTYKVELFGSNMLELKEMQGAITEYVLFGDIPYIHHKTGEIVGRLDVSPTLMGMEYLKDTNRESDHYRKQFYIRAEIVLHKNAK